MAVRIAIVGLGKIARDQHVPALRNDPRFEITAVVSSHGGLENLPTFATLQLLLDSDVAVDAVALCLPPQVRFPAALQAIAAGKHVFLEKPPGSTLSEVQALCDAATSRGITLFASWHSRHAPGVAPAREWLAARQLRSASIVWKENVRVWHPGQTWIWQPGGFGVFDPGINALSIATAILPRPFFLQSALLSFPSNQAAPVAAQLWFCDVQEVPITMDLDFLQEGVQTWDIDIDTSDGHLKLSMGGAELSIDGVRTQCPPSAEYAALYDRFSELIVHHSSDVDASPLRHVADAFMRGERRIVAPFS